MERERFMLGRRADPDEKGEVRRSGPGGAQRVGSMGACRGCIHRHFSAIPPPQTGWGNERIGVGGGEVIHCSVTSTASPWPKLASGTRILFGHATGAIQADRQAGALERHECIAHAETAQVWRDVGAPAAPAQLRIGGRNDEALASGRGVFGRLHQRGVGRHTHHAEGILADVSEGGSGR